METKNCVTRSWRPGCPASPPQGDTLTLSLIHHLLATTSINMSLNISRLNTQFWTLKETGALRSLGQGQNSPSPLWKNLVKLIIYYRAQWYKSTFGNSPFNQIPNPEYSPMWPLKRTPKSTEILRNSYAKQSTVDFLSLLSL